jgi:dihydrofolate reductase
MPKVRVNSYAVEEALFLAKEAAGERDVRIGGGAATIRQYLEAQLIDEMHIAMSPVVLGSGEPFFRDLDLPALDYRVSEKVSSEAALHVVFTRSDA